MRDARRRLSRRTSGATPHDEHAIKLAARDEPARSSPPGLLKLEVHAGVTPGCQRQPRGCNRCKLRAKAVASDAPATCSTGLRALRHSVSHLRPNPPGRGIGTKSMTQFEMRCLRTNTDRSSVRTLNVPTLLGYCAQVPKTSALLSPLFTVGQHECPTGALVDGAVVHDGSKLSSPASLGVSLRLMLPSGRGAHRSAVGI